MGWLRRRAALPHISPLILTPRSISTFDFPVFLNRLPMIRRRSMPAVARKDDRCETPLWRDDLTRGRRVRAWVERIGDQWSIAAGEDRLILDPRASASTAVESLQAWLRRNNLRLSPRALTLTAV